MKTHFSKEGYKQQYIQPRGLNRSQAADYIGVSKSLFDEMVRDGRMPEPKRINSRTVWDRNQLDEYFEDLSETSEMNPWDKEDNSDGIH